jgi:Zn-dependent protease
MTKQKPLVMAAAAGAAIGAAGIFVGRMLAREQSLRWLIPAKDEFTGPLLLGCLGAVFLALVIHELGHLVAGLAQGFQFALFVVGPLGVRREESGAIRMFLNRDVGMMGGLAATCPLEFSSATAGQMAWMIAAGPITSLVTGVGALLLLTLVPQPWRILLGSYGIASCGAFLVTVLPGKSGLLYTDRKRLQRLMSRGRERDIEMAMIHAGVLQTTGKPMRGMKREELELILEDPLPIFRYTGHLYLLGYHANDPEQFEAVRASMKALEPEMPALLVKAVNQEAAKLAPPPDPSSR